MTMFDVMILVPVLALLLFELRQEAGRGVLDATVTVAAIQLAKLYAPAATSLVGWEPLARSSTAPGMYALCFGLFWVLGLAFSRLMHSRTRWSMDQFDPLFGAVFGVVVAVSVGHVLADVMAQAAIQRHGHLPEYFQSSWVAEELRSFRTYNYVLDTMHSYQYGN